MKKVTDWARLPSEILDSIFRNLDRRDNAQCSLTCRRWRLPAQSVLFEELPALTDQKMKDLLCALFVYQDSNEHHLSPGNFVKSLGASRLRESHIVSLLDKAFPYLEIIDPPYDTEDLEPFYRALYRLIEEGSFPNLRKIPRAFLHESQLNLVLARKERIKEIQLQDERGLEYKREEILQNLDLFPKLKKLQLVYSRTSRTTCLEDLLLKVSPSLTDLRAIFLLNTSIVLNTSLKDLDNIQPLFALKRVDIRGRRFLSSGDNVFRYLMKKFPQANNMKVFFQLREMSDAPNYKSPTSACVIQFLLYLYKMKGMVSPIVTNSDTNEVIQKFFEHVLKVKPYYSKNFSNELTVRLDTVEDEPPHSPYPDSYITAYNHGDAPKKRTLTAAYKVLPGRAFEAHLDLIRKVGGMGISSLCVGDNMGFNGLCFTPMPMDTIINQCKRLNKLRFHGIAKLVCNEAHQKPLESSLEDLEFVLCFLTDENLAFLSQRFTTLKSLNFHNCFHVDPDRPSELQDGPSAFSIDMPNTRLEVLKIFASVPRNNLNAVFKLTTKNKKPRYSRFLENDVCDDFGEEDYDALCLNDMECKVYNLCFEQVTKFKIEMYLTDDEVDSTSLIREYLEEDL